MKHDSFNESAEMYMKTIAELDDHGKPVPISALAGRLGVSAVSATEIIHRLEHNGLIAHFPYKGVALTNPGRQQAVEVIRSHRLWECFLTDRLGISWQEAHDLACRLEHATDAVVTDALEVYLGHPPPAPTVIPFPPPTARWLTRPTGRWRRCNPAHRPSSPHLSGEPRTAGLSGGNGTAGGHARHAARGDALPRAAGAAHRLRRVLCRQEATGQIFVQTAEAQ